MVIFVDTSALIAVLDRDEARHTQAFQLWDQLLQGEATLLTTNYVLLETAAVIQRRVSVTPVRVLHE